MRSESAVDHKTNHRSIPLRDEDLAVRLDAASMDSLTVRVGRRFSWSQPRIQGTLEFLELDETPAHSGCIGWTIFSDQQRHFRQQSALTGF
jgi:hypothetical protein